jgi:PTS system mannose-specific IIA component
MVGFLIVSHGAFAEGLGDAAQMIMGEQDNLVTLGLQPDQSPENLKSKMKSAVERLDQGEGVLVLVDLFGGTPGNTAAYLLQMENELEVLTGINLPLLLELLNLRSFQSIDELVDSAKSLAGEGFKVLSDSL